MADSLGALGVADKVDFTLLGPATGDSEGKRIRFVQFLSDLTQILWFVSGLMAVKLTKMLLAVHFLSQLAITTFGCKPVLVSEWDDADELLIQLASSVVHTAHWIYICLEDLK